MNIYNVCIIIYVYIHITLFCIFLAQSECFFNLFSYYIHFYVVRRAVVKRLTAP